MSTKSQDSKVWDAIVVGAGPAGSALAILLARRGWETLLLDSARFPRGKVCGECLSTAALDVLAELGLVDLVRTAAIPQRELRITVPGGAAITLALADDSQEGVLGISRHMLDELILDQAQTSGAKILLEHRVRRVFLDNGRTVGVEAAPLSASAPPITLRGHVVIAADGRYSHIVRQTGKVAVRGPHLVGVKCHRPVSADQSRPRDAIEMISLRGGYLGRCEVEGQQENVCGLLPRAAVRQARGSIDTAVATLLGDHELTRSPAAWLTIPDVRQQRAVPQAAGVVYVGDALATIEPLAGQGMTMALISASLAADLLARDDPHCVEAAWQSRYQRLWWSHCGRSIARGRRLGWLLRHPAVLQSLAALAPASPTLEDFLMRTCYRGTRVPARIPRT